MGRGKDLTNNERATVHTLMKKNWNYEQSQFKRRGRSLTLKECEMYGVRLSEQSLKRYAAEMKAQEEFAKKEWKDNGIAASTAGTKMHYDIECYYNDMEVEVEEDCVEWQYFEMFEEEWGQHMTPYRTEWMIWDDKLKFAGSIDMTFLNSDGTIEIYDWKRSVGIKKENQWQSAITPCIDHLPDCNFYHYSLQLNTYKALLEKNYGVKVGGMYLVCLHPNNENKSYQRIEVADLQKEVKDLFRLRRLMLKEKQLKSESIH